MAITTKTSVGNETVNQTVARAKAMVAPKGKTTTTTKETPAQTLAKAQGVLDSLKPTTINSSTLQTTPVMNLTQPKPAMEATGMNAEMAYNATTANDTYNQNLQNEQAIALSNKNTASSAYNDFLSSVQGKTNLEDTAYSQKRGVDDIQTELNDINQQLLSEQHALTRKTEELEKNNRGMLQGGLNDLLEDTQRESLRKQADLSIIQMGIQGRYDSAKAVSDRAVSAYLEKQSILNDTLKFNYEESKELFNKAEQRAFESAQADRERKLNEDKENMTAIRNLAIDAQQAGASTATVQSMLASKTLEEAMGKTGGIFAPKPSATKLDTAFDSNGNLVDMQTGEIISDAGGATGVPDAAQKSLDQFAFLNKAINEAKDLVDATGPNMITQGIGNLFVGNTRVKQLQNKIDSLKTNLLTLNTDPNVKKFFGPQMSNKDTELLLSAGSTLDAYSSSEKANAQELVRYQNLIGRMEKAVKQGLGQEVKTFQFNPNALPGSVLSRLQQPNILYTPDGLQIEITD